MDEPDFTLSLDDTDPDPVDVVLHFAHRLEAMRSASHPLKIERDRLFVTLILALLSDPHHPVGQRITRPLFRTYIERGGKVPRQGRLSLSLLDDDQFTHTVGYLFDSGMKPAEIARALGVRYQTVTRYLQRIDQDPSESYRPGVQRVLNSDELDNDDAEE